MCVYQQTAKTIAKHLISYKDKRIVQNLINKFDLQNFAKYIRKHDVKYILIIQKKRSLLKSPVPKTVHCNLKKHTISLKIYIPAPNMILLLLPKFKVPRVCRSMIFQGGLLAPPLYTTSELKYYFEGCTTIVKSNRIEQAVFIAYFRYFQYFRYFGDGP